MNLRILREQKLLSQEQLAELSALGLRTIQRVEAGHRVSYASLRSVASALQIDVDQLERELYAVNKATDDFVEAPRWARLLDGKRWFGGRGLRRRDFYVVEAFCLVCAAVVLVLSFQVSSSSAARLLRTGCFLELGFAYFVSVNIRLGDKYKLWPGAAGASPARPRTWRTKTAEYTYLFGVGILGTVIICWLLF
jgi:transcriptional regulator with XRE-family HTH domain